MEKPSGSTLFNAKGAEAEKKQATVKDDTASGSGSTTPEDEEDARINQINEKKGNL